MDLFDQRQSLRLKSGDNSADNSISDYSPDRNETTADPQLDQNFSQFLRQSKKSELSSKEAFFHT